MTCRGFCQLLNFPLERLSGGRKMLYAVGYKRCKTCGYFTKTKSLFCPCCGLKFRTKPASSNERRRLLLLAEKRRAFHDHGGF